MDEPNRVVHSTTVAPIATTDLLRHNIQHMKAGNDDRNHQSTEPASSSLAELLTRLRLEAGISMYELAKRTGINRSTLLRIEVGTTTNPDTGTLNILARALGVEPELFYDAVWQDADQPLPSPALYFRSKYRLTDAQIAELEASVKQITERQNQPTTNRKKS